MTVQHSHTIDPQAILLARCFLVLGWTALVLWFVHWIAGPRGPNRPLI